MQLFAYRAIDATGRISTGRLPALNVGELEARLRNTGLDLIKATPARASLFASRNVPRKELINFCFHMEQTLHAGLMVTEALGDLVEHVPHEGFRTVLTAVLQRVNEGTALSAAMSAFPQTFDDVFLGLMRMGETSGQLPAAFAKLGEGLRWQDELAAQFKKLILYPAFTLTVLLGVTLFILLYLVPQLSGFIRSMSGGALPFETRLLLGLSEFLQQHYVLVLATPPLLFSALWLYVRFGGEPVRYQVDRFKLALPIIGPIIQKILLARFATLLGMLYESGLPLIASLHVARDALGNRVIAGAVNLAARQIEQGSGITEAFAATQLFPNLMLRMIRIGETTSEIGKSLRNVSYFYNREVQESIGKVQAMVEPALTVVLGLLLGWLMMSVLGPIYDLLSKIKT